MLCWKSRLEWRSGERSQGHQERQARVFKNSLEEQLQQHVLAERIPVLGRATILMHQEVFSVLKVAIHQFQRFLCTFSFFFCSSDVRVEPVRHWVAEGSFFVVSLSVIYFSGHMASNPSSCLVERPSDVTWDIIPGQEAPLRSTSKGIVKGRGFNRISMEERWCGVEFENLEGTP